MMIVRCIEGIRGTVTILISCLILNAGPICPIIRLDSEGLGFILASITSLTRACNARTARTKE